MCIPQPRRHSWSSLGLLDVFVFIFTPLQTCFQVILFLSVLMHHEASSADVNYWALSPLTSACQPSWSASARQLHLWDFLLRRSEGSYRV